MKTFLFFFFLLSSLVSALTPIEKKLIEIEKAGIPTTFFTLERKCYPPVDPENNAASLLQKAFDILPKDSKEEKQITPYLEQNPLSPEGLKILEEFLQKHQAAFSLLYEGAQKSSCRFALDFLKGLNMPIPSLLQVRLGMRLFQAKIILSITSKDSASACETMIASLRYARFVAEMPVLICNMIGLVMQRQAYATLSELLSRVVLSEKELLRIQEALEPEGSFLRIGLCGELCTGSDLFQKFVSGQIKGQDLGLTNKLEEWWYRKSGAYEEDFIFYLQTLSTAIQICQKPSFERIPALSKLFANPVMSSHKISNMLTPSILEAAQTELETLGYGRNLLVALRIERYRLCYGKLPSSLTDLGPEYGKALPADVHTNEPLQYKLLPVGYILYGLGRNLKDDGGISRSEVTTGSREYDIVLRVIR